MNTNTWAIQSIFMRHPSARSLFSSFSLWHVFVFLFFFFHKGKEWFKTSRVWWLSLRVTSGVTSKMLCHSVGTDPKSFLAQAGLFLVLHPLSCMHFLWAICHEFSGDHHSLIVLGWQWTCQLLGESLSGMPVMSKTCSNFFNFLLILRN